MRLQLKGELYETVEMSRGALTFVDPTAETEAILALVIVNPLLDKMLADEANELVGS